jgi:hypothetical protein
METDRLSAVTAAVLADAAFDVTGETTRFSTQRYREIIEHIRRTGEMPRQPCRPTPATDISITRRATSRCPVPDDSPILGDSPIFP